MTEPSADLTVFFAYGSSSPLRAETMRDAIKACNKLGLQAEGWEEMLVGGRLLVDAITERIRSSASLVAEVSSLNANVLFEAGYALALGKHVYLALDNSDQRAITNWRQFAMADTIGRVEYNDNSNRLAEQLVTLLNDPKGSLLEEMLAEGRPREPNAVFVPAVPLNFNAAERLQALLDRKTDLKLLARGDDLSLAQLPYYVGEVYRSSAAIFHLMLPRRINADVNNARASFLAGIARGFELPTLMVAEAGFQCALDYKDIMYSYDTAAHLTEHVEHWLGQLPSPRGSNKRLGRLKLDIELPLRSFGKYVAESERDDLTKYFVQTNEFEAVMSGRAQIFTGRKGTGKTATMLQAVEELRKDKRILVVPVKPSSYDLAGLVNLLGWFVDSGRRDYFLVHLWTNLLTSEIAIRAISHAEELPAGLGGDDRVAALAGVLESMSIDREADMSTRLDTILNDLQGTGAGDIEEATQRLRSTWTGRQQEFLRSALRDYDRVAVLIDNLDKTWERGVDFTQLSHFLLSLLVTSGKIELDFSKQQRNLPSINLTLAIFLRTDIFDVITSIAREPDKISPQQVQWADEELLVRVLEERYAANLIDRNTQDSNMWAEVFCDEVHGLTTRDYMLWRALPRPRDVIYLGNAALTAAINRKHERVVAQDFEFAEKDYSRFAVEALLVESQPQGFDLEEVLFGLAGLTSTLEEDELLQALTKTPDPLAARDWLVRTSFLGLETRDEHVIYVEGDAEARKKMLAARRLADRKSAPIRFHVHPAFRPCLDIPDDDLHGNQEP
ncbi:MAG: hypothetical protein FWF25_01540 [Propionibacteriaceae bacterium]|nr:hypothetical protein [Propionibacteriaceae bacterium]